MFSIGYFFVVESSASAMDDVDGDPTETFLSASNKAASNN